MRYEIGLEDITTLDREKGLKLLLKLGRADKKLTTKVGVGGGGGGHWSWKTCVLVLRVDRRTSSRHYIWSA